MKDIQRRTFLKALGTAGTGVLISPDFIHTADPLRGPQTLNRP